MGPECPDRLVVFWSGNKPDTWLIMFPPFQVGGRQPPETSVKRLECAWQPLRSVVSVPKKPTNPLDSSGADEFQPTGMEVVESGV